MKVKASSRPTDAVRSSSFAGSTARPRLRTSSSATASATSPDGSMTITVSRLGRLSRTATILATWDASSQTIARDSELPTTHSHSFGEFVG
jgi:hypothetical protein